MSEDDLTPFGFLLLLFLGGACLAFLALLFLGALVHLVYAIVQMGWNG